MNKSVFLREDEDFIPEIATEALLQERLSESRRMLFECRTLLKEALDCLEDINNKSL